MLAKVKLNFVTFLPQGLGPLQKGRRCIIGTIFIELLVFVSFCFSRQSLAWQGA